MNERFLFLCFFVVIVVICLVWFVCCLVGLVCLVGWLVLFVCLID